MSGQMKLFDNVRNTGLTILLLENYCTYLYLWIRKALILIYVIVTHLVFTPVAHLI